MTLKLMYLQYLKHGLKALYALLCLKLMAISCLDMTGRTKQVTELREGGGGGGLVTYIHKKHGATCEAAQGMDTSSKHIEAQWVVIHRAHSRDIVVCKMYRPPDGDLSKAVTYLGDSINSLDLHKLDFFMLGDFNVAIG